MISITDTLLLAIAIEGAVVVGFIISEIRR